MYQSLFMIGFLCLVQVAVYAQEPLVTDRPGEGTDSPGLLSKGFAQLETGFFLQRDHPENGGEVTLMKIPTTLVRLGVLDNFEFRIARDILSDGETSGVSPLNLGAKVGIAKESQGLPALSLLTAFTLPSNGSKEYQTRFTQPSLKLLMNKTLTEFLSLTANAGAQWENDQPGAVYTYALSFDLGLADNLGGFVELYGFLPEKRKNDHLINGGITYLLNPNLQLDFSSGLAFTPDAPDYFVSVGLSWRVDLFPG